PPLRSGEGELTPSISFPLSRRERGPGGEDLAVSPKGRGPGGEDLTHLPVEDFARQVRTALHPSPCPTCAPSSPATKPRSTRSSRATPRARCSSAPTPAPPG